MNAKRYAPSEAMPDECPRRLRAQNAQEKFNTNSEMNQA